MTGAFAAADWMFSIAPGGGVSASAAASLRFGPDRDGSSDGSEPPLHGAASQQDHVHWPAGARASPQLAVERDPSSHAASSLAAVPHGQAVEPRPPAEHAAGEAAVQPAQPQRRRVSFANRLPAAASTPSTSCRADAARAQDDARATAERVAAQVTAEADLCHWAWMGISSAQKQTGCAFTVLVFAQP